MMEMREIVALTIAGAMVVIIAGFAVRHFQERRKFKIRQQGRGKNSGVLPAE
jgi:uncharacterized membrane protein SpoIIM required for sporulation